MKTKEHLLKAHAEQLDKFDREEAIRALLPEQYREDALICIHGDHASAKLWSDFRTGRKLSEAVEVIQSFADQILTAEHWKDGCISTGPEQINSNAKNENAVMIGSHAVEIVVHGGKWFGPYVELRFYVNTAAGIVEISCPVCDLWKLIPQVDANYSQNGELASCRINWPVESRCVDSFRTWWSEKPSYRGSYYLADLPSFLSWASNHTKPELVSA